MTMVEAVAKLCVPLEPEREGYHWVRRFRGGPAIPLHWNPRWWHNADRGWGAWGQPERESEWEYLGPCPSPDDQSQSQSQPQETKMTLYRRKPGKPIEAKQWNLNDGDVFMMAEWPGVQFDHGTGRAYIETMHAGQRVFLEKGDWILPEPDGVHFYPCKPDVFAATYEAV